MSYHYHNPVLLQSVGDFLAVQPQALYIDATLGGGGHAAEIIRRGGRVLGLDQDPEAISACPDLDGLTKVQTNFIHLAEVAAQYHWRPVAGILLDLGLSRHQVEQAPRGFSFQKEGPLDMRMGTSAITAADIVNQFPVEQLTSLFRDFGDIPVAKTLAVKIIANRPMTTTGQLAKVCGKWSRQAFQALRIAVNDELGALQTVLPQVREILAPGGRLVIISFHSLEDRIVKRYFKDWQSLTPKPITGEKSSRLRAYAKN